MQSALYAATLQEELDGFQAEPEIPSNWELSWAEDEANDYTGDAMVTATKAVEGGMFYMIRGLIGRRAYLELRYNEPHRFFWTVAGNGTPVYEITSDMNDEDGYIPDIFGHLLDIVFRLTPQA